MKINEVPEPQKVFKLKDGVAYMLSITSNDIEEREVENKDGENFTRYILQVVDDNEEAHELSLPLSAVYSMRQQVEARKLKQLAGTKWLFIRTGEGLQTKYNISYQA